MQGPDARIDVAGCDVILLGTVAGFVPDGARVEAGFARLDPGPEMVALGIPPEDVSSLEALHTAGAGPAPEMPDLDPDNERLLELLKRFGDTKVPSPDLEAAYRLSKAANIPVVGVDLDDAAHAEAYTERVKLRHVVRSNWARKKAMKMEFKDALDAYDLAVAWEKALDAVDAVQTVHADREEWMANRVAELCKGRQRVLVVVPATRWGGVLDRLRALARGEGAGPTA